MNSQTKLIPFSSICAVLISPELIRQTWPKKEAKKLLFKMLHQAWKWSDEELYMEVREEAVILRS